MRGLLAIWIQQRKRAPPEGGTRAARDPWRSDYISNLTSTKKLLQLPLVGKVSPATQ